MLYTDLKLEELREKVGLDYAAFTYSGRKCSCCYGPLDLKKKDWSPKAFERAGVKTLTKLRELENFEYTYLQFSNSCNGWGEKTEWDELDSVEYIRWNFDWDKMDEVVSELQQRVGEEYLVVKPEDSASCITIYRKDSWDYRNYLRRLEEQNATK